MTNSQGVITRTYKDGDADKIVDLLQDVFGTWPPFDVTCTAREHWDWKYRNCPGEAFAVTVCDADRRIVGCSHGSTLFLKIDDRVVEAAMGGDHAVHRDFRDLRLSGQLRRVISQSRIEQGVTCVYFETRHPRLKKSFSKYCEVLPLATRHLVKTGNVHRHLRARGHRLAGLKSLVYGILSWLNRARYKAVNAHGQLAAPVEIRHFDSRFDRFWDEISGDYRLIVVRDSRFLNWRFADSRAGNYRIRAIVDHGEIQGFIVVRVDRSNPQHPEGYIVDLLYRSQHDDVAVALLSEALEFLNSESVNAVHCMVPQAHPARSLLGRFGFVDILERNVVFLNPLMPDKLPLAQLKTITGDEAWYSYGDIDSI